MRLIKLFTLVAMIACSTTSYAIDYSQPGEITGMFTGAGNTLGVFHGAALFNPAHCTKGDPNEAYLLDYGSQADWNKLHSMLLAAYISGTPIRIGVDPSNCHAGYPIIVRVAFVRGY